MEDPAVPEMDGIAQCNEEMLLSRHQSMRAVEGISVTLESLVTSSTWHLVPRRLNLDNSELVLEIEFCIISAP